MSRSISGLGIDMGLPTMAASATNRKRSQSTNSAPQEFTESLNQYNNNRRHSQLPTRRPTTASERKVRIASGQPGILGVKADDDDQSDSNSYYEDANQYATGPMNRNKRLSVAVAAQSDRNWDSASSATPSDMYNSETSPDTESSNTSYSSGGSSLKRNMTVRKQRSQSDLTSTNGLVRTQTLTKSAMAAATSSYGPPRATTTGMARSRSSNYLPTQHNNDSSIEVGSTSLGRSNEIPRSGSRGAIFIRGGRSASSRGRHARSATWDPRSVVAEAQDSEAPAGFVPDGFGGFIPAERAAIEAKPPSEPSYSPIQPEPQQLQVKALPSRPLPVQPTRVLSQTSSQASSQVSSQASSQASSQTSVHGLRVGSFYAPDGSETARLSDDGRLSMVGSSRGGSTLSRSSHAHSASQSSISQSSVASSQRSRARSHSGPRPLFMSSPVISAGSETSREVKRPAAPSAKQLFRSVSYAPVRTHSTKYFQGLEGAERGEAMVSLDSFNETFEQGELIEPSRVKPADQGSILESARPTPRHMTSDGIVGDTQHARRQSAPDHRPRSRSVTDTDAIRNQTSLDRSNTLISSTSNPARRSKDLSRLLANSSRKLTSASSNTGESVANASTDSLASTGSLSRSSTLGPYAMPPAVLEQGKSGKNRVDVDLVLESDLVVEGGYLRGRLEIKVRKESDKDGPLMLTQPKVRVVGFEELLNDDTRHIFYHHATVIDGSSKVGSGASQPYVLHGTPSLSPEADNRQPLACFASPADGEGYCVAREGTHSVPFAMELPVGKGAKGSYRGKHAIVRYIVIGSVKLKSANGSNRSIAHFYRHVELYPYLNPAVVLSTSSRPIQASASKGLFLGGTGKVHLSASLHRGTWIAGQRVYVNIKIDNETSKKVKSLTLALVRTVTLFRPRPELNLQSSAPDDPTETYIDPDACTTSTSRKKISEEVLEMGQKGAKGVVTAKGWWTGVEGGDVVELSHNMKLPVDALTIIRGRHVEVLYSIKVSISSSLSSDVSVELPVRVVNFVSLDPPPLKSSSTKVTRTWSRDNHQRNALSESEAPMIERMKSMEAFRSPYTSNSGLDLEPAHQSSRSALPVLHQSAYELVRQQQLQVPGGDKRLQHQKSLDFINHAIRSATARKTRSNEPSPMGLGIDLDSNRTPPAGYSSASSSSGSSMVSSVAGPIHPSCAPYDHHQASLPPLPPKKRGHGLYQHPVNLPINVVSMDDDDDDDDDSDDELGVGNQTLNLNDESVDEVDFVIGSARLDGGESSPEFQDRQVFGEDQHRGMAEEEEGNDSTSTITSQQGIREEDEYDEEEERLDARQPKPSSLQAPALDMDDEPTPLAHSPPKFPSNSSSNRLPMATSSRQDIPQMRGYIEDSEDDYNSSSTSSSRRTFVRTKSDLERQSTIIRGPSGNVSRPVSPSKQAPSPTKSALKSKLNSTLPTIEFQTVGGTGTPVKPPMMPLTLKAKVDYSQVPRAAPRGMAIPSPTKRAHSAKASDSGDSDSYSSTSPASSVSLATPESFQSELTGGREASIVGQEQHYFDPGNDSNLHGLGLQPFDATPKKSPSKGQNDVETVSLSNSRSTPSLVRTASAHNLRGSTILVPSVRDKIAMLESRKQALRDFTGSSSPANNSNGGTPTKLTPSNSRSFNDTTPTRIKVATRQLERNNSYLSDSSSQADYLQHTPSIANFKAPIFNTRH